MKCDEAKPACNKCLAFGTICEGYEVESESSPRWVAKTVSKRVQELPLLTLEHFPEAACFKDENDFQYFRYFREHTVFEFVESLGYDPAAWNRILFQACEEEPPLRRLLLSVAAMSKSGEGSELSHYQYAVRQYGQALREIQRLIVERQDSESDSTRTALLTSLLVFCFEGQNGNPKTAIEHLQSALLVLQKRVSKSKKTYSHIIYGSPVEEIEYELFSTFLRIDHNLISKIETGGKYSVKGNILEVAYVKEPSCPYLRLDTFSTVWEARDHFEHLVHRFLWNSPQNWKASVPQPSKPFFFQDPPNIAFPMYDSLVLETVAWSRAVAPLIERSSSPCSAEFVPVRTMKVQSLCLKVILRSAEVPDDDRKVEDILSFSSEIVALSQQLAANPRFHRKFSFETGIIQSLFTVVIECRNMHVRRKAVEVLKSIVPRRENMWDSTECAEACEHLLDMEETASGGNSSDARIGSSDDRRPFHVGGQWHYRRLSSASTTSSAIGSPASKRSESPMIKEEGAEDLEEAENTCLETETQRLNRQPRVVC